MTDEHEKLTAEYRGLVREGAEMVPSANAGIVSLWMLRAVKHILARLGPPDAMAGPDADVRRFLEDDGA